MLTPSAQRLFRPARTLPGPHSTSCTAPLAARVCTHSTQRTGLYSCSSRSRLRVSRSAATAALTFCTSGICGACQSMALTDSAKRSAAGRISSQCDGTLTGSGSARLAPAALQASMARPTAALAPATTTWPGELKFTALTTSPWAASAQIPTTTASSRPRIAAMAPCPAGTASCMSSPRRLTSFTASPRLRLPAATRALYSPRLWPETNAGRAPPSASHRRHKAIEAVRMAGWVLSVWLSCSSGPFWVSAQRS
ncbi:hypothetical protein D3C80_1357060 [compost metagenome]